MTVPCLPDDRGILLAAPSTWPRAGETSWQIVSDVAQDQIAVAGLRNLLSSRTDLQAAIAASTREATESLVEMMAPADALQRTGDRIATAHQFSNVTYNVMRGGVPFSGYVDPNQRFRRFRTRPEPSGSGPSSDLVRFTARDDRAESTPRPDRLDR